MELDLETIGYYLFMEEQEKQQEEREELNNVCRSGNQKIHADFLSIQ